MRTLLLLPVLSLVAVLLLGCLGQYAQSGAVPSPVPSASPTGVLATPTLATPTPIPPATAVSASPSSVLPAPSPTPSSAPSASVSSSGVQEIAVTAKKWEFDPGTSAPITVRKGIPVRLLVTVPANDTAHGIAIPDLGVNAKLPVGQTTAVEFTPQQAGTFSFYCDVFCGSGHREMTGTIVVTG